jgi:MFS transporter, SP family, xylose:H+ symportor
MNLEYGTVQAGQTSQARPRLNAMLIRSAIVASLGGLLFGFDTAVISGTTDWLKNVFALSDFALGFTVASALIGTIVGSIAIGKPADRIGRRGVLFLLAVLYIISAIGCAFAWGWWPFMIFRLIGGVAVGGASVVSPMYIAEISPAYCRGRFVAVTQFNVVLGALLAYLSNYIISSLYIGATECRWMFGVMAAPSIAFFLMLFLIPESPRWLLAKGRSNDARQVLQMCGTDGGSVEEEVTEIQASLDMAYHTPGESLFCWKYTKPIFLAVAIAAFNQLSGINALTYYMPHIFKMAGYRSEDALLQSVVIGCTNLLFTMIALTVIDYSGRRKLMLIGSVGYIVSLSAAGYLFYVGTSGMLLLASFIVFAAAHSFSQGTVIWVFISEIFPNIVRARGQALGSFTHWIMAAGISWTFPIMAAKSGGLIFAFYALCMVVQLFWVIFAMPETKGISLEKIQKKLGIA